MKCNKNGRVGKQWSHILVIQKFLPVYKNIAGIYILFFTLDQQSIYSILSHSHLYYIEHFEDYFFKIILIESWYYFLSCIHHNVPIILITMYISDYILYIIYLSKYNFLYLPLYLYIIYLHLFLIFDLGMGMWSNVVFTVCMHWILPCLACIWLYVSVRYMTVMTNLKHLNQDWNSFMIKPTVNIGVKENERNLNFH